MKKVKIPKAVVEEFKNSVYEGHDKASETGDTNDLLTMSDGRQFYSYGGDLFIYDPEKPEIEEFSKEAQIDWEHGAELYWADKVNSLGIKEA